MNKWLARVLGVIILAVIGVFFFDGWFHPKVPRAVLEGQKREEVISLTPTGANVQPQPQQPTPPRLSPPQEAQQESISLTSLQDMESDKGAPPPVLANPQGNPEQQPTTSEAVLAPPVQTPKVNTPPAPNKSAPKSNTIQLESLPNAKPAVQANTSNAPVGSTWIQAGSFGEKANADRLAANIRGKSLPAVVEAATVNGKTYHRVYVGPIASNRVSDTLSSLSAMGVNARQINR